MFLTIGVVKKTYTPKETLAEKHFHNILRLYFEICCTKFFFHHKFHHDGQLILTNAVYTS